DQAVVLASLRCPASRDRREVRDVVGEQSPFLALTGVEERFVGEGFPPAFDGDDHVVSAGTELVRDGGRVVVVQRQLHPSAWRSRSQRSRSSRAAEAAASAWASTSSRKAA